MCDPEPDRIDDGLSDQKVVAQILFATLAHQKVRIDAVLLDDLRRGPDHVGAGTPISLVLDVARGRERNALAKLARDWADVLRHIDLVFVEHDGRQLVVLAAGEQGLLLNIGSFS